MVLIRTSTLRSNDDLLKIDWVNNEDKRTGIFSSMSKCFNKNDI